MYMNFYSSAAAYEYPHRQLPSFCLQQPGRSIPAPRTETAQQFHCGVCTLAILNIITIVIARNLVDQTTFNIFLIHIILWHCTYCTILLDHQILDSYNLGDWDPTSKFNISGYNGYRNKYSCLYVCTIFIFPAFSFFRTGMSFSCSRFSSGWRRGQSSHYTLLKYRPQGHSLM
jgi:hypothetical protein